ncbi:hypothetical protein N7462_007556 [Penicillium macrosclerotiorum]|uniref:uncharacterized protein n=1 Tax=Penicillium macrosclerotiorum TaxID=303699 RepID=UPI0025489AD8|nr:uncharacterized protein N7462_007556 [Penicillium macrosclerotiorum]KAJ5679312.1 hypothetical protein N7462_007556 [Penicillium macrosclerotiorum]
MRTKITYSLSSLEIHGAGVETVYSGGPSSAITEERTSPQEISSPRPTPEIIPLSSSAECTGSKADLIKSTDAGRPMGDEGDEKIVAQEEPRKRKKKAGRKKKRLSKRGKKLAEENGLSEARVDADTPQQEGHQQEMAGSIFYNTGQPLPPRAEPTSCPATPPMSPMKDDQGQQGADNLAPLVTAAQFLDVNNPSSAAAADLSRRLGSDTLQHARHQKLASIPEVTEAEPGTAMLMPMSNSQGGRPAWSATPATTPSSTVVAAGRIIHDASLALTPAMTPSRPPAAMLSAGRMQVGGSPASISPVFEPGLQTVVSAGRMQVAESVPGAIPAMTPGSSIEVPAGRTQELLVSTPVATPCDAHRERPSQRQLASTPGAAFMGLPGVLGIRHYFPGPAPYPMDLVGGAYYATLPINIPPAPVTTPDSVVVHNKEQITGQSFWDLTYHTFQCALWRCEKQCHLWDSQSVVCPACGPFSSVIYCSKDHMREDASAHWLYCGQGTFEAPCKENSVPPDVLIGPPLIPNLHGWDSPERFRQGLWFCTARQEGDYFIFADWEDQVAAGIAPGSADGRCSPRLLAIVRFDDPAEKDRFRRILAVCLFASIEVQPLVGYMYRLLRDRLVQAGRFHPQVDVMLRHQLQLEQGVTILPQLVGQRHACETEWDGLGPRHCRDPICMAERPMQLGDMGWGRGFRSLCTFMESCHWILRAHRTTHPTTSSIADRTRGDGFDDVVLEDRRSFRRGEGWDGAGTGPMEIESPVWR